MPEILGNAAVFFDPLDVSDMAERIIALLSDEAARDRLTRNARARARRFSWTVTARETAEVIKSAAPQHRRKPSGKRGALGNAIGTSS